ncbi:MAG: MarR family transcriptional regulator [Candidatus Nanopelagicales bacterium]|nr:MarR family transcriptional regulator [Candidatus Nanopelagicales bacterium]
MEIVRGSQARGAQERVARALLESGPATVAELAERLDLTGAAVRKHLDDLLEVGHVESSERPPYGPDNRPRGRGRPARFYHLTQAGRDSFETAYEDVAVGALRFVADTAGSDAVMDFARRRVAEMEAQYADLLDLRDAPAERAELLADSLTAAGYAAVVVPTGTGVQLCQHNCPIAHVAQEFPQFCEAETEAFGRLLGTHVMRLATLANGDGVCTTHIPTAIGRRADEDAAAPPLDPSAIDAPVAPLHLGTPTDPTAGRTTS